MHLYTPIDWVPTLVLYQDVKTDPVSFTIHKACLKKGNPGYNEVGNAPKTFLHIQVLSVFELEQVIKVNEIR